MKPTAFPQHASLILTLKKSPQFAIILTLHLRDSSDSVKALFLSFLANGFQVSYWLRCQYCQMILEKVCLLK